eukprot:79613_1
MSMKFIILVLVLFFSISNGACNYVESLRYVSWPDGNITVNPQGANNWMAMPSGVCLSNDTYGFNELPFFETDGSVKIMCNQNDETIMINKYQTTDCSNDPVWNTMYSPQAKGNSFNWDCGGLNCVLDLTVVDHSSSNCSGGGISSRHPILVPEYCYGIKQYGCTENSFSIMDFQNETGHCQNGTITEIVEGCLLSGTQSYRINRCIYMEIDTTETPTNTTTTTERSDGNVVALIFVYTMTVFCAVLTF